MRYCLQYHPRTIHESTRSLFLAAGLGTSDAADIFGTTERTIRRWRRLDAAPLAARRLLVLLAGNLGGLWPDWHGFRFADGLLWTPEDQHYSPGQIRALHFRQQLAPLPAEHPRPAANDTRATPTNGNSATPPIWYFHTRTNAP